MVELAMVLPVFLFCQFAVVAAALHSYEVQATVTALSMGLQHATSSALSDLSCPQVICGDPIDSFEEVERILKPSIFGTRIVRQTPRQPCSGPVAAGQVEAEVMLCVWAEGPTDTNGRPTLVAERVVGTPARLMPLVSSGPWWMIDVTLETHSTVYQTG